MKHTIIDINELSDSKEVYGQRPNPFIPAFIYSILALLLAAVLYSCFGKIEIVAKASGFVRPNEDVSTISSLLSGRITSVCYADGQFVQKGDPLLTLDTSELQISLNSLTSTRAEYETKAAMMDKFISGIEKKENPFSSDRNSEEYPYYVQFRDYELSKKNSEEQFDYDAESASANIVSINQRISDIEKQIDGLKAYKASVESGTNQAAAFPEYENMYLLYAASVEEMDSNYNTQREKLALDQTSESNQYYLDYYEGLISDYGYLVKSIEKGKSVFPEDDDSLGVLLWKDYRANLDEYERQYASARYTYEQYRSNANAGSYEKELLAFDRAMLEGYEFFRKSVKDGSDKFDDEKDSIYYRSLYTEYKMKYDALAQAAETAGEQYETLAGDPSASPDEISAALSAKANAEAACEAFKSNTLVTINNTILQIQASIAEKEFSIDSATAGYNVSSARVQMESAAAAIDAYTNQKLAEYEQVLADYKAKMQELSFSAAASQDKAKLLTDLESSYKNAVEQNYHQTITQINSSLQSLQTELVSARSSLRLYQITSSLYDSSVDEDGVPISISLASMNQVSSLLTQQENLESQIKELNVQIQQTEEKISQGTIVAEQDGIVSVIATLVNGDSISAGTPIATVIPPSESEFKVQLYVSNADIANISIGDEVKYNLSALPSNQYGMVNGKVTSIATDTLVQDGQYSGYYLVECSIANTVLTDKDGNSGSVVIGMQTEAKIVTQKKTIIRYLLEKINLF